jgi:hypothetical protein
VVNAQPDQPNGDSKLKKKRRRKKNDDRIIHYRAQC